MSDAAPPGGVLEGRGVCKNYGGLRAVVDVSFVVRPGEILGVVGPNGAGKTSLFDVITGLTKVTDGDILLEGQSIVHEPVHRRTALGVARTFQQPTVADSLSVLENLFIAASFRRGRNGDGREGDVAEAFRQLDFVGLGDRGDVEAGPLGVFDKKRLMLGTALATNPKVLLLDEPFGGLNPNEIGQVMRLIGRVRDRGLGVIVIEHVMRALTSLADRVLVMHHGAELFAGTPEQMLANEEVIDVYLGQRRGEEGDAR